MLVCESTYYIYKYNQNQLDFWNKCADQSVL